MHPVASFDSLDTPRLVQIGETRIVLFRDGETVHAVGATCPHAGAPMQDAALCDGHLICPWHKAKFRLSDGALIEPPALDPLPRYPVRVEGGQVLVSTEALPAPAAESTTPDPRTLLIVGAGAAGTAAACALRERGFAGRVVLVGDEPGLPYDRTALSKMVLQGEMPLEKVPPLRSGDFFDTQRIERLHATATGLDTAGRRLTLASGGSLSYDRILIASGGTPRPLQVPGAELSGVHLLRSRADIASILDGLGAPSCRVVIVGSGFIGLEAAAALRSRDIAVTVVSRQEIPFQAQFGHQLGMMFRRLHEGHGVRWIAGRDLARIEGSTGVEAVRLDDGERLPASLVLSGLGITPTSGFASDLKRTEDGGILVDASMRVAALENAGGVYAAGDVARFPWGGREGLRIEHWRTAEQTGRIAAAAMLDQSPPALTTPFFWTYHYGKRYEYVGHPERFDRVDIDGDPDQGDFLARLSLGDRLVGLVACGRETETAARIASESFAA